MASTRRDILRTTALAAAGGVVLGSGIPLGADPAAASPAPWDQVPAILARIVPPTFPSATFDIRDHGAVGDNTTDCTPAFRAAIQACSAAGGGRVLVPASGTYRTGKIHLLSNVNLHVESGATIRFRTDTGSYLPTVFTRWQGIECYNWSPFIYALDQTNVAITGAGIIDGNAQNGPWFDFDSQRGPDWDALQQMAVDGVPIAQRQFGDGHYLKPNMIQLYRCTNVLIEGVDIRNSAMWAVHPVLCTNVTVRGIKVFTRGGMVDGCDPESCTDVHIHDCRFDTGDDGIAIKSGRDTDGRRVGAASQNIVIERCTFLGRWGAVTVGSEMSGGVRNVFAQDCTIQPGASYNNFHAVYLKTNQRRGGIVENINVRRISGGPCDRGAIHVDMNYSLTGPGYGPIVNPIFRNIHVDDLSIADAPYAVRINGLAASPLTHFHLSNSTFTQIDTATPSVVNANDVVFQNVRVNGVLLPGPAGTRYEAENATISQGVVESNHAGFSGTGFVNLDNVTGSWIEWTVTSPIAGQATLTFRYANGTTANRPMTLGGATLAFPATGAWTSWATATATVPVVAGANAVRLVSATASGGPNLDCLDVAEPTAGPAEYQAENALISQGVVESNHAGFTGTGFVNGDNVAGAYVQFSVTGPASSLVVRYANGTTTDRPMAVTVNGSAVATLSFPGTGAWSTWATRSTPVTLPAGPNTVRLTATTANGGPNLDKITIS
ncbi:MAG: carbohydrate-binding protein [Hamadaea sp.]|nr:carbohydrate-binding protein [Hamadaea sp.]